MASFAIIIIVWSISASATASAQVSTPLTSTPSGLVATPVSVNQIELSWNAPTQNYGKTISGYKIEELTGWVYNTLVENTASPLDTYLVTELDPGKSYTFRVSAVYSDDTTTNPSSSASASLTALQDWIFVTTDKSPYTLGEPVTITAHLPKFEQGQTITITVTSPSGNMLATRTITATTQDSSIQILLPQTGEVGNYRVSATSGYTIFSSPSGWISNLLFRGLVQFTVKLPYILPNPPSKTSPPYQTNIILVQPTDQEGNSVLNFVKGKDGFVKVTVSSQSIQNELITIDLMGPDLTSLGTGSIKNISSQNSEMTLSFFIPDSAVDGTGDICVDVYSDWPKDGGIPLASESCMKVQITIT